MKYISFGKAISLYVFGYSIIFISRGIDNKILNVMFFMSLISFFIFDLLSNKNKEVVK